MTAKKLLQRLEEKAKGENYIHSVEWALLNLLKYDKEAWSGLFEYSEPFRFHKLFRQTDVFQNANLDMAVWNLLGCSTFFWDITKNHKPKED